MTPCPTCARTGYVDRVGRGQVHDPKAMLCLCCKGRGWLMPASQSPKRITASAVITFLDADTHEGSGWVRNQPSGIISEPREIWLQGPNVWIRANGTYASGYPYGRYLANRFGWFDAWRIRRAVRRWSDRRTSPVLP